MSAGVRKPPVAPKPKILQPQRPTPPPIAPKPEVVLSYHSPAAAKKAKPAVAPKPCLPKTTGIPALEPKPLALKSTSQTWSHEKTGILENMGRLNSKNERGMELSRLDLDYIIPTCTCIQESCLQCNHVANSKMAEMAMDRGEKCPNEWQSSRTEESAVHVSPFPRPQSHLDKDKTENCKNHLVNARFLEQKLKDVWVQAVSTNMVCQKPQEKTQEQPVNNMVILDENLNCADNANRSGGKCMLPERSHNDDTNGNIVPFRVCPFQEESKGYSENLSNAVGMGEEPRWSNVNTTVPSAPKKPLPVPMPRKLKRSLLVRQNGVEVIASEEKEVGEKLQGEANNSLVMKEGLCPTLETFVQTQSVSNLDGSDEYSIPPDDTAEKSSQHGFPPCETSHSLSDQMVGFSLIKNRRDVEKFRCSISEEEEEEEEKEDEGEEEYGDFARYPMTRSLPKQLKLNCNLPLTVATRVTSVEESPKVVPKKPQRNSLPGSALLKTGQSEEELDRRDSGGGRESWLSQRNSSEDYSRKENGEAMREVPAPLAAKSPWRLRQAFVPFFKKQTSESSSHGNTQSKWVGCSLGKPRAKSFTSVELDRNDGQKRSSFRRFLELNVSVKLLSRLLAKRGQSLDCTTVAQEPSTAQEKIKDQKATPVQKWQGRVSNSQCETPSNQPASGSESPYSPADWERSLDGGESLLGGESTVEYENVPLYAEIPEYMNLPFLGASGALTHQPDRHLGWWNSSSLEEGDGMENAYENQELHRPHDTSSLEEDAGLDDQPVPGEKFGSSSAEEDDVCPGRGEPEFRQQSKAKTKVVHIAMEIMSSEKVFVDVLKLLHIDFRDAVAKATRQTGKPVIEERALNQILYYLPQLYELNRDLLKELEERVALWNKHQRLADIFVKMGPYLKMYSTYIREFDRNVALLDEQCRKNPGFAAVVREFELSPRSANLALKHYLLKPVQRIPQYQLLLTDYLKNLPEDSSDYKDTQAALGVVKEVASHANGIMKQGDNFQKLMRVQYSLNGQHEVVQPGRVFLKEGVLKKLSRKVMQPRMFFLFNDILLYTTPVQSAQYKLNGILPLAGMKVSKPSQEAYQNELNIESVERSFILSASSAAERDEWLEAISKAIDDYTRKKITFFSSKSQEEADVVAVDDRASLGSKAPIWIPDLRATMCMICTCEFTLTWRRHHCRACGKVICQACSSHKQYLEYLKYQPARVCDHCFLQLQKGDRSICTSQSPSGKLSSVLNSIPARKQKKIPATLKEVSANTENSSMSGYLQRSKGNKKQWKRLWFVIKNKVLYTYAASEDVAALESQPLLGFYLREERSGSAPKLQFKLYHKNTLFYIFKADDPQTAQKWKDVFQEAMIL